MVLAMTARVMRSRFFPAGWQIQVEEKFSSDVVRWIEARP